MEERVRDVVIIGGGHNGLACAAYLARAGLDVCVLERRGVLGGASVTEEPWPGYRVSSAAYVVSLLPDRIVKELDLRRHGYEVSIIAPDYVVPFPDGTSLTLWGDLERDVRNIARLNEADARAYAAFDAYFERIAGLVRELLWVVPPNLRLADAWGWLRTATRLRGIAGRDLHELVRLFTMSAADFLDEWFVDDRVKGALATQAIIGAWCGPMTPGSAYVLMHHWIGEIDGHSGAWGWVKGGMGGVATALAEAARAHGVEIRTEAPVARVVVNAQGRATGVELVDGTTIAARQVVSNAHPITTYLALVGREHLPSEVVRDIERYRTRSGSVKVNVALGELPTFPCWDQEGPLHRGLVAISPSIEYLERAFDDAKYGQPSRHPYVEVVFPTAHEDGLAPEGKHLMLGFSQYLPYDTPNTDATREAWARSVLEALEAYAPGLSGLVEHAEVLTPRDLEERYGLVGGNIMHGELVPDQLFSFRPIPFYGDHRTPIRGLYLCGAGTHPGGGVMAVPGRNAARVILRDARLGRVAERVDGALDQVRGLLARD
ncbi:MAG: FAD-dependent oxidoreductase [Actinomycetota bacterium]|jgi:phytoene dehydrogenase-like protein|nr:MAG: FAD-dependent oxidoreductase [Actinomycetota bacterium]